MHSNGVRMRPASMDGGGSNDPTAKSESRRRSVPGSSKSDDTSVDLVASTTQGQAAAPFKDAKTTWYWKVVRREGPLLGLLATGTGMVVLNQFIADQVIICRHTGV